VKFVYLHIFGFQHLGSSITLVGRELSTIECIAPRLP